MDGPPPYLRRTAMRLRIDCKQDFHAVPFTFFGRSKFDKRALPEASLSSYPRAVNTGQRASETTRHAVVPK